ncbi:unnamed protein product [Rhizophagus irregularis]|nr:unnamed protein product [Rhizophagus irregularis]
MIADLSDEQITITAGLTDILQTTMAGLFEIILLRKRKDKSPPKAKKQKRHNRNSFRRSLRSPTVLRNDSR